VVVTLAQPKPDLRVCVTINGHAASTVDPAQTAITVPYFRVADDARLGMVDVAELQIDVSRRADDAFVGTALVPKVNELKPTATAMTLELFKDEASASAGTLDVTVAYHKFSVRDSLALHVRNAVAYPSALATDLKLRAMLVPPYLKSLVLAGLPGLHGGAAASWFIVLLCCIPFVLVSLLTNFSWATRQWFLVVPVYVYTSVSWPIFLGWVLGTLITVFAMHGYPGTLKFGAVHVTPWISGWSLHLRVTVYGLAFGNPPGFPLENFLECRRIDVSGRMSFKDLLDAAMLRYKRCPLKKVPDFRYLIKFDIEYIEFEDFMVDFQMYDGKFNIHAFTRMIAEGEARNMAWLKGYMKTGDPMPNELEVRIIRCQGLVKTRTSKKSLMQQVNAVSAGPLGHNAVIEAFADDQDEAEDDADSSTSGAAAAGGSSRSGLSKGAGDADTAGANDEDDGGGGGDDDDQDFFKGLGPPSFNPADASVKPIAHQGHFDPYVVVTLRRDKQKTHTQTKTNSPMFNETFYFHATDAATVVHVAVYNREVVGGDVMLGQWIVTLKYLLGDPTYCWHEKGMQVTPDRWVRGWFPLQNKHFRGVGKCGKIEMALQWRYVPEDRLRRRVDLPPLSALAQLQENSDESRMRMGDMQRVKYWLNREPFLFDIKRMTVRGFKFHLQDLFRGYKGRAETAGGVDKIHFINLHKVEWLTEFRPKHGDDGITVYKVLYEFFAGIAPKVLDLATSHANVGSTLGTILGSSTVQLRENVGAGLKHLVKGEFSEVGALSAVANGFRSMGKATDRAVQLMHRTVTQNQRDEAKFKVLVTGEDEDYLLEQPELSGHLARYAVACVAPISDTDMEREVERKGHFTQKFFELKGRTLFYRKNQHVKKSVLHSLTYKIELASIKGAIFFADKDELVLNHDLEGFMTRLRPGASARDDDDDMPASASPPLEAWLQMLKAKGVPCFVWSREKKTAGKA